MSELGGFKVCPFCKERIRSEAVKCRFCGEWLEKPVAPESTVYPPGDGVKTARAAPPALPAATPGTGKAASVPEEPSATKGGEESGGMGAMKTWLRENEAGVLAPTAPGGPGDKSEAGVVLVGDGLSGSPEGPPKIERAAQYRFTKDSSGLTALVKRMIWIEAAGIVLFFIWFVMEVIRAFRSASTGGAARGMEPLGYVFIGAWMVATISAEIAFLVWVYRANLNCHGFGARNMSFSPGWSVGWYFIPILNLYYPYQAMKEIWKASKNPENWQGETCSGLVGWWWALRIISFVCAGPLGMVVVGIPACVLEVRLVSEVFAMQRRLTALPGAAVAA